MTGFDTNNCVPKSNDIIFKEIDRKLDYLSERVQKEFGFEYNENGSYKLLLNGEALNISLSEENLLKVVRTTKTIIDTYIDNGENDEIQATDRSKGEIDLNKDYGANNTYIDLTLNNTIGDYFDRTYLTDEGFTKVFGVNPSRGDGFVEEYADFLNRALGVNIKD